MERLPRSSSAHHADNGNFKTTAVILKELAYVLLFERQASCLRPQHHQRLA